MPGAMSLWHWLIVILVVSLLFGRNMISSTMEDLAKGIKKMKSINDEEGQ